MLIMVAGIIIKNNHNRHLQQASWKTRTDYAVTKDIFHIIESYLGTYLKEMRYCAHLRSTGTLLQHQGPLKTKGSLSRLYLDTTEPDEPRDLTGS